MFIAQNHKDRGLMARRLSGYRKRRTQIFVPGDGNRPGTFFGFDRVINPLLIVSVQKPVRQRAKRTELGQNRFQSSGFQTLIPLERKAFKLHYGLA